MCTLVNIKNNVRIQPIIIIIITIIIIIIIIIQ